MGVEYSMDGRIKQKLKLSLQLEKQKIRKKGSKIGQKMNRSKSSNIFHTPSYVEYFNCEDIDIEEQSDQVDQHYGSEEADLGWMAVFDCKDRTRKRRKRAAKAQTKASMGLGQGRGCEGHVEDSIDLKQKIRNEKVYRYEASRSRETATGPKLSLQQWQTLRSPQECQAGHSPKYTDISNTATYSTTQNLKQEQSTREESLFCEYHFRDRDGKEVVCGRQVVGAKNREKGFEGGEKVLEYEIQIDKLSYELESLRAMLTDRENNREQSRETSCEFSMGLQDELQGLRQALLQQTQAKQAAIRQRDLLLNELSEALKCHDTQQNGLRQELTSTKQQLTRSVLQSQTSQSQVQSLSFLTQSQSQRIAQLTSSLQSLRISLENSKTLSLQYQEQLQRVCSQHSQQSCQLDILVQSLENLQQELESVRRDTTVYQEILKEKEAELGRLRDEIDRLANRCQGVAEENQELRRRVAGYESSNRDLERIAHDKVEEVNQLYNIVNVLTRQNEELASLTQRSTPQKQYQYSHDQLIEFIEQLKSMLSIRQSKPTPCPQLLDYIENILQYNHKQSQISNNYQQILEMFNIPKSPGSQDRLLSQIGEFRNNMGILVKKVRGLEKKNGVLAEENKRLVHMIRKGYREGVGELERLVQEQNEEIVRYRMQVRNFKMMGVGVMAVQ